jgi:hypothetical protein
MMLCNKSSKFLEYPMPQCPLGNLTVTTHFHISIISKKAHQPPLFYAIPAGLRVPETIFDTDRQRRAIQRA